MSILILHTLPPERVGAGRIDGEFDLGEAATAIAAALPGALALAVEGTPGELVALLDAHRPSVVFNLCEAPLGRPALEPHAAALFEWRRQRFTGAGSETLALCRNKPRANAVLAAAGLRVPGAGGFPCVVKPACEDGSAGIDALSLCADAAARDAAIARLGGPALVQDFLPGREFAVSLWGRDAPDHASIGESGFLNGLRLLTYAAKWDPDSADFANSPLDYDTDIAPALRAAILAAARATWAAVGARHYLRVDIRLDGAGRPCVLDVNPNPEIGPGRGISRAVEEAGWAWPDFVASLAAWA